MNRPDENTLRPLLIDSDVTVSTLSQKSSRVLGEKWKTAKKLNSLFASQTPQLYTFTGY